MAVEVVLATGIAPRSLDSVVAAKSWSRQSPCRESEVTTCGGQAVRAGCHLGLPFCDISGLCQAAAIRQAVMPRDAALPLWP